MSPTHDVRPEAAAGAVPFRGKVTILRTNPNVMKLFWLSLPVLVGLGVLIRFVPVAQEHGQEILVGGGLIYVALLSVFLRPKRKPVKLEADGRGLFVGGQRLAARKAISEAYLREASEASEAEGVVIPARPLTVELITDAGPLYLDAGSEEASARILVALGFPVTRVAADHLVKKAKKKSRR